MRGHGHSHHPTRDLAAGIVVLAMLVASLSLWTAIPLTWIYIGSQLSHTQFPSSGPYMIVLAGIIISILIVGWVIGRLNALYVRITGSDSVAGPPRPAWMKSMRDSSQVRRSFTVLEVVVVGSVLLACLMLGIWFFFWAGSPIPAV